MAGLRDGSGECRSACARNALTALFAACLLAACAVAPPPPSARPSVAQPAPPAATPAAAPSATPPAQAAPTTASPAPSGTRPPAVPAPASSPSTVSVAPQNVPPSRPDAVARYDRVPFSSLPAVADNDWIAAWPAFLQSCAALTANTAWKDACARSAAVDRRSASAIRGFFGNGFDAWRVRAVAPAESRDPEVRDSGLVTGYYEPLLKGSRKPSAKYRVPLYRVPDDLITVDLANVYPEFANVRMRGRLQGKKIVPYPSRGEINASNALRGSVPPRPGH